MYFGDLQIIETVHCIGSSYNQGRILFQQIKDDIHRRKLPCFAGHIRAHLSLPGPLAEDNALADKFIQLIALSQVAFAE